MELTGLSNVLSATLTVSASADRVQFAREGLGTRWVHADNDGVNAISYDSEKSQVLVAGVAIDVSKTPVDDVQRFLAEARRALTPRPAPTRAPIATAREHARLTDRRNAATIRAHDVAGLVEVAGWVFTAIGVIGGIAVAAQTERSNGFGDAVSHLYAVLGLAFALVSAFWGLAVVMIAAFIRGRTE